MSQVAKPEERQMTQPISAAFKPKAGERKIRIASKEDVEKASQWVNKTYAPVLRKLAQ